MFYLLILWWGVLIYFTNNLLEYIFYIKNNIVYINLIFLNIHYWNITILLYIVLCFLLKYNRHITLINLIFIKTTLIVLNIQINTYFRWVDTLVIGFNNIHPLIYYFSFISILVVVYKVYSCIYNYLTNKFTVYTYNLALILGMYWGLINSIWSFFWVNDIIEIILLSWCVYTYYILHNYSNIKNITFKLLIYSMLIILCIMCTRLNLLDTKHSFFVEIQLNSYTYITYIILLFNNYITAGVCIEFFKFLNYFMCSVKPNLLILYIFIISISLQVIILGFYIRFMKIKSTIIHVYMFTYLLVWVFSIANHIYISKFINIKIINYCVILVYSEYIQIGSNLINFYTYFTSILFDYIYPSVNTLTVIKSIYINDYLMVNYCYFFILIIYITSMWKIY